MPWLAWLLMLPNVLAQDDAPLTLDSVVVSPFEPTDPALRPDAERLRGVVERALAASHLVVPLAEVRPFTGYGPEVYVRSCPEGRYVDCVLVVAQRAGVDWTIGGQVRATEGGLIADLFFVRVRDGTLVLDVEVGFDGEDDPGTAATIGPVLDALVQGQAQPTDVRLDPSAAPDPDGLDASALEAASDELDALEAEEGAAARGERGEGQRERVGREEILRWSDTDATPPWEHAKLTSSQWLRWRNSGRTLPDFKSRARGRQGEILVGLQLIGLSWGPWNQAWDGWYALDDFSLDLSDQYVQMDLQPGLARSWELSLGAGPLPWLDVQVFGGVRLLPWRYTLARFVEGSPPRAPESGERTEAAWMVGGRVTFAPMPAFPARPIVQAGVLHVWGTPQSRVIAAPEGLAALEAVRWLLIQANVGVEVDLGRWLHAWARAEVEVPLGRQVPDPVLLGGEPLVGRPSPNTSDESIAVGGAVGLTARIRIHPKGRPSKRAP